MVPAARAHGEDLLALALLRSLQRPDLIAFAGGELGAWTRILAPRLGAPVVFCAAGEEAGAPGQPAAARLVRDFAPLGAEPLAPIEAISGVAGKPIAHSLSPRLHNAAYRALGLARLYLPFYVESFGDFWLEVVEGSGLEALGFPLRGLSVTAPFKEAALAVAGVSSPLAERVGAANTLVLSGSVWEAETTDPDGVVGALRAAGLEPRGRRAAVVGAGGAGRAAAEGLRQAGAAVTLVHRDVERGRQAAARLDIAAAALAEFRPGAFELVVHATPLGHRPEDPLPFDPSALRPGTAVVDLVYREGPTALLAAARDAGCVAVDGREVLVQQAAGQFRLMTGQALPLAVARRAVGLEEPGAGGAV
jgi:3-dehydroquinate dehydratase/shikimate dehydrogenase